MGRQHTQLSARSLGGTVSSVSRSAEEGSPARRKLPSVVDLPQPSRAVSGATTSTGRLSSGWGSWNPDLGLGG